MTYCRRFLGILFVLLLAGNTYAQTTGCSRLYVDSSKTTSGNGSSWATAFKTVSQALDSANSGTCSSREIWVAKGTYYPMSGLTTKAASRDSSFRILRNGIKFYGGFAGGETAISARNIALNPTILSGDIGVAGDSTDNCSHVVTVVSNNTIDTATHIDGLTIKGGNASGANTYIIAGKSIVLDYGGGIYNSFSAPLIRNCVFSANAADNGGAMYNESCSPEITKCIFSFNRGKYNAGGVCNSFSSASFTSCVFFSNSIMGVGSGGGVYNKQSPTKIANCIFVSNGGFEGGGIFNYYSSSSTINCTFLSNTSVNGAGIYNFGNSPSIHNCILWGNSSSNNVSIYDYVTVNLFVSYTTSEVPQSGNGNNISNPLFVNAANPIGPDGIWGTADDGLRLQAGSPAINSGNSWVLPAGITTDIAGTKRILQTAVDRGAHEANYFSCATDTIIYVDSSKTINGDGSSWANAYKTLSEGLSAAHNCPNASQVWVAKGTYFPMTGVGTATISRDSSFRILRNGIKLYGGFAGGETLLSARSVAANPTVLSGDIGVVGDSTDNSYHVVTFVSNNTIDTNTCIDGFTIEKGNANGTGNDTIAGQPVIRVVGGGMYIESSSPSVVSCNFSFNNGGGGGGIYNSVSSPRIANCNFSFNKVVLNGGGVYNYASPSLISNCVFNANSVSSANSTTFGGGGIYNFSSSGTIKGCTFYANVCSKNGGGIYNYISSPQVVNSVFILNTGDFGGAIHNFSGYNLFTATTSITNCTFYANSSFSKGGAMFNDGASPRINNCIFRNNTSGFGGSIDNSLNSGTNPIISYSTIQTFPVGSGNGAGNSTANPLFTNAANGVGPDGIWGTSDDGLRLTPCSGAINTGSNALLPAGTTTDITGTTRIQNTTVDRGAYEMSYNPTGLPSTTVAMSPANGICSNTLITFTATTVAPGSAPTYQWYKNGVAVGNSQNTYTSNSWNNSDSVWVVHTNNNCSVNDTSAKSFVQLVPLLAQPGAVAGNPTPCPGTQTYSVAAVTGATSYNWTVPAGWIITAGQGTVSVTVTSTTTAGNVSVTANNSCAAPSVASTLVVNPYPTLVSPSAPNGPAVVCASSTNTYSTQTVAGASTYTWAVPAGWVITAGQGTTSITVTATAGTTGGLIEVTAGNVCQISNTAALSVTTGTIAPTVIITKNTGDTICAGTPVTFTAVPTIGGTAPSYQWIKNGTNVGTNSATYTDATLSNGDNITVMLTSNSACASVGSVTSVDNIITVNPNVVPVLTVTASPGLSVPAGSSVTFTATVTQTGNTPVYQWFKNAVAIGGANSSTYTTNTLAAGDLITVQVGSLGPCATPSTITSPPLRISDPAGIQTIGENGSWQKSLSLFPNPSSGQFTIAVDWNRISAGEQVEIEVVNNLGQAVYKKNTAISAAKWNFVINLNEHVANGLYMLRLVRQKEGSRIAVPVRIQ